MSSSYWDTVDKPLYYNDGSPCNARARVLGCASWATGEVKRRFDGVRLCFRCGARHRRSEGCAKEGDSETV